MKNLKLTLIIITLIAFIGCGANKTIETNTTDAMPDTVESLQTIEKDGFRMELDTNLKGSITDLSNGEKTDISVSPGPDGGFEITVVFPGGKSVIISGHVDGEGNIDEIDITESDSGLLGGDSNGGPKTKKASPNFKKIVETEETSCGLTEEGDCLCWHDEDQQHQHQRTAKKTTTIKNSVSDLYASSNIIYILHDEDKISIVQYAPTSYFEGGVKSLFEVHEIPVEYEIIEGENDIRPLECFRDEENGELIICKPDFSDADIDWSQPEILFSIDDERQCFLREITEKIVPSSEPIEPNRSSEDETVGERSFDQIICVSK